MSHTFIYIYIYTSVVLATDLVFLCSILRLPRLPAIRPNPPSPALRPWTSDVWVAPGSGSSPFEERFDSDRSVTPSEKEQNVLLSYML